MVVLALLGAIALGVALYLRSLAAATVQADAGAPLTEKQLQEALAALCRTRGLAENRPGEARQLFYERVHSPLHVIAAGAGDRDRQVAARMLEAKNDVEQAFAKDPPAAATVPALDRLMASTEQALRSVGVTTSTCELP